MDEAGWRGLQRCVDACNWWTVQQGVNPWEGIDLLLYQQHILQVQVHYAHSWSFACMKQERQMHVSLGLRRHRACLLRLQIQRPPSYVTCRAAKLVIAGNGPSLCDAAGRHAKGRMPGLACIKGSSAGAEKGINRHSLRSAASADFDGLPWQQPAHGPPVSSRHTVRASSKAT